MWHRRSTTTHSDALAEGWRHLLSQLGEDAAAMHAQLGQRALGDGATRRAVAHAAHTHRLAEMEEAAELEEAAARMASVRTPDVWAGRALDGDPALDAIADRLAVLANTEARESDPELAALQNARERMAAAAHWGLADALDRLLVDARAVLRGHR